MAFDYKTGNSIGGRTQGEVRSAQSGADLLKNIRAGIKSGSIKTK